MKDYDVMEESKRSKFSKETIFLRVQEFLRSVVQGRKELAYWRIFKERGAQFALPEDIEALEAAEKAAHAVKNANKDDLAIYEAEIERVLKRRKLNSENPHILLKKAEHLRNNGDVEASRAAVSALASTTNEHHTAAKYELLLCDMRQYTTTQGSSVVEKLFDLSFSGVLPNFHVLENILAYFIDWSMLDIAITYFERIQAVIAHSSHHAADGTAELANFGINLAQLLMTCQRITENISEGDQKEKWPDVENLFDKWLNSVISLKRDQKVSPFAFVWSSTPNNGVLKRLTAKSANSMWHLVCLLEATLLVIQKAKKKLQVLNEEHLIKYGLLGQLLIASPSFSKTGWATSSMEHHVYETLRNTLEHLHLVNKSDSRWLYAQGDALYEGSDIGGKDGAKQKNIISYYLHGCALDTAFFTSYTKLPSQFVSVVKRLTFALQSTKASLQAAILCQFGSPVDYNLAFQFLQDNVLNIDPSYCQYIWELPILELLLATYSKTGDERRCSSLIHLITRPELNQYNAAEAREIFVDRVKMNFLKQLSSE
eukprot:TRINITY_DN14100_c0_g1_i1.p1 TRINITY_DN14100_c0_g1~~TRINITY_DN14100_c0_g1_i1.p1  ORF type:complete len:604 (-),score=154.45 TRINITY_DN14100_c0_g1_i1:8-1633(-)